MGWRYLYFTSGAFVLVLSIARVTIIRFHETPKYLICRGQDEAVVALFQNLSQKYGRRCSLTLEGLQRFGTVTSAHSKTTHAFSEIFFHYRGLFVTRKAAWSTILVWLSWTLIGLAYPLFYVFLPDYLASRGAEFGQTSVSVTWRNYVIAQVCAIFGPLLAGYMCQVKVIGRKYTMVFGALISSKYIFPSSHSMAHNFTVAFFFAYTAVRNNAQNVGFNCAVSFAINIYYGTLYAYSPEVMPSAHRATGNGTAVAFNRIMGIMSAIVATYANTSTPAPMYISAALFGAMAMIAVIFPFEPERSQSG
jgi:hypothetical protein